MGSSRRVPSAVLGAGSWVLALPALAAQDPPRFAADVELVVVDAVVLDGAGEPVAGLVREDFTLRDEGEPREILSFEAFETPAVPAPPSRSVRRVSTNVDAGPRSVAAVLWDDVHLSPPSAARAKRTLRPWLIDRLRQGDPVVVASTGGAWRVADGPGGRAVLLAAVDGLEGRRLAEPTPDEIGDAEAVAIADRQDPLAYAVVRRRFAAFDVPGCRPVDAPFDPGPRPPERFLAEVDPHDRCPVLARARQAVVSVRAGVGATLQALARVVDVLSVARGRKSIVLVSEGFTEDPGSREAFARVARAAEGANAVVAYLDPEGLREAPGTSASLSGPLPPADHAAADTLSRADRAGSERVARETGGLVLRQNDLAAGLERVSREDRAHYLLGFAPAEGSAAGRFRRIAVTVARRGLKVRARPGYVVGAEPQRPDEEQLRRVLDAPFDFGALPLRVADLVLDPLPPDKTRVVLGVDVAFPSAQGPQGRERECDLLVEVRGAEGRWQQENTIVFPPVARGDDASKPGWSSSLFELELPAGPYRARVVAREKEGPVLAAVAHDFEVPSPGAFRVSTLLLSDTLAVSPESGANVPVAATSRELEVGAALRGRLKVFGLGLDANGGVRFRGGWSLRPTDGSHAGRSGSLTLLGASRGTATCGLSTSLEGISTGEYELVLRVRDEVTGRELRDAEALTLVAPTAASRPRPAPAVASEPGARAPSEPADPELARLLEKAGEYVVEYEQRFRDIVAEEEYVQWVERSRGRAIDLGGDPGGAGAAPVEELSRTLRGRRRVTRADLVFVQLGDESLWTTFRDVFEVDGEAVRDRDARLERLFLEPGRAGISRAREIMSESAAYNIGPVVRTINVPTFPLVFLHPKNQARFRFERKGRHRIEGVSGVEVRFEETGRPTFVSRERDADLPAEGSFWIDPARGTVLRSRIRFEFPVTRSTATVTTEYHPEPRLAMWLPSEMQERYEGSGATARYSNFRRFGVSVDEKAQLPEAGVP